MSPENIEIKPPYTDFYRQILPSHLASYPKGIDSILKKWHQVAQKRSLILLLQNAVQITTPIYQPPDELSTNNNLENLIYGMDSKSPVSLSLFIESALVVLNSQISTND